MLRYEAREAGVPEGVPWTAGIGKHLPNQFRLIGFKIKATEGTHRFLTDNGLETEHILKMHEGRPNIVDAIKNDEIQLIINTPVGKIGNQIICPYSHSIVAGGLLDMS